MAIEYSVTGTSKAAIKASVLLDKSAAGLKIRKTEWPAWMRTGEPGRLKLSAAEQRFPGFQTALVSYLNAMDIDESEADPRAVCWEAYGEWCAHDPQAGRCNVCGHGTSDGAVCDSCAEWGGSMLGKADMEELRAA